MNNTLSFKSLVTFLILLQILVYMFIFGPISLNKINLDVRLVGDFPSYWLFDFSSLELILSQHRTFGFPLILKIYRLFDYNLIFWPQFTFVLFSLSNIFLFYSLNTFNFNKIFSLYFILGLTFSHPLYVYLSWWTELYSISFLIIALGFMFLSIKKNKIYYYLLFSFFLFYTYQIRGSFVIFIFVPIIFCLINLFLFKNNTDLKKVFFFSITPLIIFLLLRFFVVGSFGLLSFNYGMSAKAFIYLTDDQIPKLKIENQKLAKKLLERKRKLPYPCNLDLNEEQISYFKTQMLDRFVSGYGQYPCWNPYYMTVWLELIKLNLNIEPFPKDDERNIDPWNHVPLGNFWQEKKVIQKNVELDNKAIEFGKDVMKLNYKKVLKKFIKSPIYFLKLQRDVYGNLIIFYIILIIPVIFFIRKPEIKDEKHNYEFILTLSFLIVTIGNFIILYVHQNGDPRATIIQTFYLIPIFMSYLLYLIHRNLSEKIVI